MDRTSVRERVAVLFPARASHPRTTRVAIEHELLVADARTGAAVPVADVVTATAQARYCAYLGFEPGGQVELSLPPASSPEVLSRRLHDGVASLRRDCAGAGIRLEAAPVDIRPETEVPLQLLSPRYLAMQRHFDAIGPAGRTMMRRTASTQVCLDWWPGRAGLEQWHLLQLSGPFLAAAFAGHRHGSPGLPSRLGIWLAVDPTRTAFDDRLLHGDDPVQAYTDFATGATVFTPVHDVDQHLTTLFPPVRPRGRYLEVRYPDVQREDLAEALVAVLATLSYDDRVRSHALGLLAAERGRLARRWHEVASDCSGEVAAVGRMLVALTGVDAASVDGAA